MSKVCSRWVPYLLNQTQKKTRVRIAKKLLEKYDQCDERRLFEICTGDETWIRYSEPTRKEQNKLWIVKGSSPPALPRPDHWATKVMYTIFFDAHGPVCRICTPKGQTVTGHFYATVVLPGIEKHYIERRPATGLRGIKILHDNARPHKSKEVKEKIASIGLEELEHPPYSPDLAPCDFWLFDGLQVQFWRTDANWKAIQRYLRDIPQEEYKKTFLKWIERLKLVVEHKGDYFEHL
ncbi:Transposase [Oopsacas minuta]|uniref:Transposase n=1 Tax=Oopsacas minuta TaxID=111878 RepID=A0AAV7JRI0_9METZ|nr:Transposase [Oopsacas minuta]